MLTAEFDQQEDTERAKEWKQVLDSTIAVLQHQLRLHPQTGLLADFLVYDHSERCYKPCEGKVLEKDNDGEYNWNSCRYLLEKKRKANKTKQNKTKQNKRQEKKGKERKEKTRQDKTTPFGVNLMRSPVLSRAPREVSVILLTSRSVQACLS